MQPARALAADLLLLLALGSVAAPPTRAQGGLPLAGGFVSFQAPVDLPGSEVAGAIVRLGRGQAYERIGHLKECGASFRGLRLHGAEGAPPVPRLSSRGADVAFWQPYRRLVGLAPIPAANEDTWLELEEAQAEHLLPAEVSNAARVAQTMPPACRQTLEASDTWVVMTVLGASRIVVIVGEADPPPDEGRLRELGAVLERGEAISIDRRNYRRWVVEKRLYVGWKEAFPSDYVSRQLPDRLPTPVLPPTRPRPQPRVIWMRPADTALVMSMTPGRLASMGIQTRGGGFLPGVLVPDDAQLTRGFSAPVAIPTVLGEEVFLTPGP
jgi:hypothetical protein